MVTNDGRRSLSSRVDKSKVDLLPNAALFERGVTPVLAFNLIFFYLALKFASFI